MNTKQSNRTKTRILTALSVLVVLGGFAVLASLAWRSQRPESLWQQAQTALAERDHKAARLHLESLLNRVPDHAEAHLALARIWSEVNPVENAARAEAEVRSLTHLTQAARLRTDDLELQRELMHALEDHGQLREAAGVAARVAVLDPGDADALYLLAWRAVDQRNHVRAAATLDLLEQHESRPSFRTLALRAGWAQMVNRDDAVAEVFERCARLAAGLSAADLGSLTRDERRSMCALLLSSQTEAADVKEAHQRSAALFAVLERLDAAGVSDVEAAHDLTEIAARATAALTAIHPLAIDTNTALAAERASLLTRADRLFQSALDDNQASPLVYHQAAVAAIARGAEAQALRILDSGIAASGELSHQRRREVLALHLLAARRLVLAHRPDEARSHIDVLLTDESTAGWGHLIAGAVDASDGRYEVALQHFLEARTQQGATFLVRLALAHTHLTLGHFDEALPDLTALDVDFEQLSTEEKAWATRFVGDRLQVRLAKARCFLARDEWQSAALELQSLAGTRLEPEALQMTITHHFNSPQRDEAREALEEARRRFPNHFGLAQLHIAALADAGNSRQAEELARRFAAENPESLAAQLLPIRWRAGQARFAEALQAIDRLEPRFSDNAELAQAKGQLLLAAGRPQEALHIAEDLRRRPETASAAAMLAVQAALELGDLQAASGWIESATELGVSEGQIQFWKAAVASARGDHVQAVDALASALALGELSTPVRVSLTASLLQLAKAEGPAVAAAKLRELEVQHPSEPALLLAEAEIALANQRPDVAIETLDRLENLKPGTPDVRLFRARVRLNEGQLEAAIREVERALVISPRYLPARVLAAQLDLERQHFAGAMHHAQVALAHDPGLLEMHLVHAEALVGLGHDAQAKELLRNIVASTAHFLPGHLRLAALEEAGGDLQGALETIRKARSDAPLDAPLLTGEIRLLHRLDRAGEAETLADEIARENATVGVKLGLGVAFYEAGNLTAAQKFAKQAEKAAGANDKAAAHWLSGNIAMALGRRTEQRDYFEDARRHYQSVLEHEPSHVIAANNLAWLWCEVFGNPEEALVWARRLHTAAPGHRLPPEVVDTLVTVFRRAGKLAEAVALLKEAAASHRGNPLFQFQLAMVHAAGQHPKAAEAALKEALKLGLDASRAAEARQALDSLKAEIAS